MPMPSPKAGCMQAQMMMMMMASQHQGRHHHDSWLTTQECARCRPHLGLPRRVQRADHAPVGLAGHDVHKECAAVSQPLLRGRDAAGRALVRRRCRGQHQLVAAELDHGQQHTRAVERPGAGTGAGAVGSSRPAAVGGPTDHSCRSRPRYTTTTTTQAAACCARRPPSLPLSLLLTPS